MRRAVSRLAVCAVALSLLSVTAARADDWTNLRAAIGFGPLDEVVRVLDSGVNINIRDGQGFTPLMVAAQKGDAELVKMLLDRGANPLIKNAKGHLATELAASAQVRELILQAMSGRSRATLASN